MRPKKLVYNKAGDRSPSGAGPYQAHFRNWKWGAGGVVYDHIRAHEFSSMSSRMSART